MEDYKTRLVEERSELNKKIGRLSLFIDSDAHQLLPEREQELLERQLKIMHDYSHVLNERIGDR